MNKEIKEWRPDDWESCHPSLVNKHLYEAGASAMLNALLKWLDEPCREHPIEACEGKSDPEKMLIPIHHGASLWKHRFDCSRCMAELRRERRMECAK